mmetsp:Transcript_27298/g.66404  ORF Transcript_27298/g.66404 Transcript_27298/m.66404 type:complete len:167 (+) Transcript_27298:39-539(+)
MASGLLYLDRYAIGLVLGLCALDLSYDLPVALEGTEEAYKASMSYYGHNANSTLLAAIIPLTIILLNICAVLRLVREVSISSFLYLVFLDGAAAFFLLVVAPAQERLKEAMDSRNEMIEILKPDVEINLVGHIILVAACIIGAMLLELSAGKFWSEKMASAAKKDK